MRSWVLWMALAVAVWGQAPDPLHIESFTFQNPLLPNDQANNMVSGQLVVRNDGRVAVKGVELIVHIQDGNHDDLAQETRSVPLLKPGERYAFDWQWRNYNTQFIDPLAEVSHLPTGPKADPHKVVVRESRATQPAGSGPTEGGTLEPAPSPSSTTPPGY